MPVVVANYIKRHIRLLDDKFLVLAADDIRRHLEDYAEHEPNPNLWQGLLMHLKQGRARVPLVRQGRLGLARPAGSPRFECQSKNIHDKITRKVNNVFLAGRRYFPLLRVSFPLKYRPNQGNAMVITGVSLSMTSHTLRCYPPKNLLHIPTIRVTIQVIQNDSR